MKRRVSEAIIYEAYFDLWGFSLDWINRICGELLNFAIPSKGDECEAYRNEACMAVRFQSTNWKRVERAKQIFKPLEAEASREMRNKAGGVQYQVMCG